ncbi:coiled-coil domain-containing protein 81 isoform X3 [Misgurnus anguillicaudatus]|uniref:coiled-coil domain-containing protein 81 isoform X3 n=1 Tax=Misgurnus anguillicaudatus TaxID=75329 RepID=UPI003CCF5149
MSMSAINFQLSSDDIDHIWATVSCFIEQQMLMRKGVCILGLGTFTFCLHKLRPTFVLSEKLSHSYGFKQKKLQCSDVPVVSLNFSALSVESPYEREIVQACVRQTVLLLLHAANTRHSVAHAFHRIGVLMFQQTRVKMIFYRDFISAVDAAWKLSSTLTSRPESSGRQSSERLNHIQRPTSTSTTVIPRTSAGEHQIKTEPSSSSRQSHEKLGRDNIESFGCAAEIQHSVSSHDRSGASEIVNVTDEQKTSNTDRVEKLSQTQEDTMSIKRFSETGVKMTCSDHRRAGQMDRLQKREDGRQVAAFNLAVAEAQRDRKTSSRSHGSYIFAGRSCTPNRLLQLRCYMQELTHETDRRREQQTQEKRPQQDKLFGLQRWEEMALKQSQELHDKHQMSSMYRKALDTQSEDKRAEINAHHADLRPVFGLMDGDPAAIAEQRRRAQKIAEELKTTNISRRRDALMKRLNEQKREREIIQTDQKLMLEERIRHCEKVQRVQADCERNWQHSVSLKHQRDREETDFRRFCGETLTDQLKKYERCSRCKRTTANHGQSNIFRDTHFSSGSRFVL